MKYGEFKNVGKIIFRLRKSKDWTQSELAQKLYVTDKAVSKWETGGCCPDISQLTAIAELFGVSIDYILSKENESTKIVKDEKDDSFEIDNSLKDCLVNASLHNNLLILEELFCSIKIKDKDSAQELRFVLKTGSVLFKEILDEHPIHYYEYIIRLLTDKQYKKIFEFAVDYDLKELAEAALSAQNHKIWSAAKNLIDGNNSPSILQQTQKRNNIILPSNPSLQDFNRIKEARLKEWIEKLDVQIEELTSEKKLKVNFDRINNEISREYLMMLINKGGKDNLELVAIKLCAKLESTLRFVLKNCEDDLIALIDKSELDVESEALLHQLRMFRNSIAHPDDESLQFTKEDLLKSTEIIVGLTGGV